MSHTSGMSYPTNAPVLLPYFESHPPIGQSDPRATIPSLCLPLAFQPGTSFIYSHSIDFVGVLIERVSGLSLYDYFKKFIFDPLDVRSFTFWPTDDVKQRKVAVCQRDEDGRLVKTPGGFGIDRATTADTVSKELLSGGGGLFGTQKEYLKFLQAVLRCDPAYSGPDEFRLISHARYQELFTPCIPPNQTEGLSNLSELLTKFGYHDSEHLNHSVGFALQMEATPGGKAKGSGRWLGAAKTDYWIDPATGIAVSDVLRARARTRLRGRWSVGRNS